MPSEKMIVGAGLAGLVTSLAFAKRGYHVKILERRTRAQLLKDGSGRSINLTVSARGLVALERARLPFEGVRRLGVAAFTRCVHQPDGSHSAMPYGVNGEAIYSISRSEMLRHWFALAESEPLIELHFGVTDLSWSEYAERVYVEFVHQDGQRTRAFVDQLFGADGVHSQIRERLAAAHHVHFTHRRFPYGYKEFRLGQTQAAALGLRPNAIHSWPRNGVVLMAFPNRDHSFRAILFIRERGVRSLESIADPREASSLLQECLLGLAPEALRELAEQLSSNPPGWLSEVSCAPWVHAGRIALLGDAAHGMLPFYGQGINAIFEDCALLCDCLDRHQSDPARGLREYAELRKPDTDAIAELSRVNFNELLEQPSTHLALRKRIEARLCELDPNRFAPLYPEVAFSTTPYREVLARHRRQVDIVRSLATTTWEDTDLRAPHFSARVLELLERTSPERTRVTHVPAASVDLSQTLEPLNEVSGLV